MTALQFHQCGIGYTKGKTATMLDAQADAEMKIAAQNAAAGEQWARKYEEDKRQRLMSVQGAIRVYSRPDQGTTFKVLLPAGLALPTPGPEHEFVLSRSGREGVILVIDDEDIIRRTA